MLNERSKFACCTIRTAGVIVAFVEFLLCVLSVYGLAWNLHIFGQSYFLWFLIGIISVIIILSVIILLLYAIKTENARLLLPHLFVQVFLILFLIIVALVVFLLMLFGAHRGIRRLLGHDTYHMNDESTETLGFMIIAIYLLVAAVEVCFLFIVYRLYQYLKEYMIITPRGPFSAENEVYMANWQTPIKGAPYGRGSPDAGDIYPYGP